MGGRYPSPPPTSLSGEVDTGRGGCPQRNRDFRDLTENFCPPRPTAKEKKHTLAFMKATSPQIPY